MRKPLCRSTYHRRLKRAANVLNIHVSAHSARKFYAQQLFKATGDIFEVQKDFQHKFIADTCRYLDIDYEKLQDAIRAITKPI
jgi:site-specific recombinase XerC